MDIPLQITWRGSWTRASLAARLRMIQEAFDAARRKLQHFLQQRADVRAR